MRQQKEAATEVLEESSSTSCISTTTTSCNDDHDTNKTRQQQPPQQSRRRRSSSRINVQRRPWREWQHPLIPCVFLVGVLVFLPSFAFVESRDEEVVHHLRHVVNDRDTLFDPSSFSLSSTTGVTAHSIRHRRLHPHDGDGRRNSSSEASAPRFELELEKVDGDEEERFDKDPNSPMAYANLKSSSNVARSTVSTQKAKYIGQRGTSCRDINGRHGKEGYHYVSVDRKDSDDPSSPITLQTCIDLCTFNDFSNGRNSLEQEEEEMSSGDGPEPSNLLFTTTKNSEFCYGFQFFMVNETASSDGSNVYDRPNWGPRRQGQAGGGGLGGGHQGVDNIHQQGVTGGVFGKHQSFNGCRLWKRPIESIGRGRGKQTTNQRQYCFRKLGAPSSSVLVQSRTHMNPTDEGATEEPSVGDTSSSEEQQDCPEPRLAPCTREYDPVICDYKTKTAEMIQCEYDNTCIAKLAGFTDVEVQCIHQIDLVVVGDNEEDTNTTDSNNNTLTTPISEEEEEEEVLFGEHEDEDEGEGEGEDEEEDDDDLDEDETEDPLLPAAQSRTSYSNTETQCPKPALKPCTREYDPVYCDYEGISCKYSNACIARLAGFQNVFKNCVRERDYDESVAEKKKKRIRQKRNKNKKWQVKPRTIATTNNTTEYNTTILAGNATDCPLPDPDGYCPLIYEPVVCGKPNYECRYSNGCFAQLAGYNVSLTDLLDNEEDIGDDCILVEDDENGSVEIEVQIEEDSLPAPPTSTGTCPPPDLNGICPLYYSPIVCSYSNTTSSNTTTTCEYSNVCFANLAGWNTQEHCIPKCTFVPDFEDENTTSVVPKLDDDESCGLHNTFNPVICGHSRHKIEPQYDNQKGCLYDNKCMAGKMGVDSVEETCEMFCPGVILKEEGTFIEAYSFGYPSPGSDMQLQSTMTMSLDECLNDHSNALGNSGPVVCGQNQCQYDNLCYATIGAGFDQDQCSSVNNDEDEEEDDDTRVTATCPTPDLNGICPLLYQPVVCSSSNSTTSNTTMTCDYSNQCFADLAGWTEEECIPKQCIDENYFNIADASNTTTTTTSCDEGIHNVYNPIICGPSSENRIAQVYDHQQKGCIFENKCEAKQSGLFLPSVDCEFYCPGIITAEMGTHVEAQAIGLDRPRPSSSTIGTCPECTRQALDDCLHFLLQIIPVRCGLNNCLYDNICLATIGAGFDQDQCIFIS